jgi:hypothetical protein
MTRLESGAWPLACGGGSVFVATAVLSHAPWRLTFVILTVIVAAWSLRAPLVVSVALGGMAWLFLTGFDVNAAGELHFTGRSDGVRLGVLVSSGLVGMAVGRLVGDALGPRPVDGLDDGMPGPPEAYRNVGVYELSRIPDGRYCRPVAASQLVPRSRGAAAERITCGDTQSPDF